MADFFDHRYYRTNKILLTAIGQWPYSPKARNRFITFMIVLIAGTQLTAKICGIALTYRDARLFFDSLPPLMIDLLASVKLTTYIVNMDQFRALLGQMKDDWDTLTTEQERKVMRAYTERGRKCVQLMMGLLYSAMALVMIMPFASKILRVANASDGRSLPHNVEYFVDIDKFYYPALMHGYATIFICVMILVATDAMFIVFVHHACGLFSTIGYRLEHLADDEGSSINLSPSVKDDKSYRNARECIQRHIRVLRFANVMESSYNVCFFLHAGINIIILSAGGIHAVIHLDNPSKLFKQLIITYAQIFHLFIETVQAQRLTDYSNRIHENLIHSSWYLTSFRTRKLIHFVIMRTQIPCTLTAGRLFVMSMESFSAIIRSSMSYFMVLLSMQ